jgi:hypothetical protein
MTPPHLADVLLDVPRRSRSARRFVAAQATPLIEQAALFQRSERPVSAPTTGDDVCIRNVVTVAAD